MIARLRLDDPTTSSRFDGGVVGLVATGVSLAVAGVFAGLIGASVPDPVVAVGDAIIDMSPGGAVRLGIATLGRSDKPALLLGTVVVTLALGTAYGARSRGSWKAMIRLLLAFGVLGVVASTAAPATNLFLTAVTYLMAAVVGTATAAGLCLVLVGPRRPAPGKVLTGDPRRPPATRRAFFGWAGVGLATAGVAAAGGAKLRSAGRVEAARADVLLPAPAVTGPAAPATATGFAEVTGLSPRLTPSADFYRIDTALVVPQVDPDSWSLQLKGMVDTPFEITLAELLAEDLVETEVTLSCVSNEIGGDLVGNARWLGVPLHRLLDRAGVQADAGQVIGRSVDGFTAGFPIEAVRDGRTALVAVGMNGEALPVRHGFPARLVVSGLYGYVSATKWLSQIELARWDDFDAYWIPRGWSKLGPVKTQSRIDVPSSSGSVKAGVVPVAGVAWAPSRGISRVEVQVDDDPWQEAVLGPEASSDTWVQWRWDWPATTGDHKVRVRATDGAGETQTDKRTSPAPNGASGYHTVKVRVSGTA